MIDRVRLLTGLLRASVFVEASPAGRVLPDRRKVHSAGYRSCPYTYTRMTVLSILWVSGALGGSGLIPPITIHLIGTVPSPTITKIRPEAPRLDEELVRTAGGQTLHGPAKSTPSPSKPRQSQAATRSRTGSSPLTSRRVRAGLRHSTNIIQLALRNLCKLPPEICVGAP